jgi:hypothetical protein
MEAFASRKLYAGCSISLNGAKIVLVEYGSFPAERLLGANR